MERRLNVLFILLDVESQQEIVQKLPFRCANDIYINYRKRNMQYIIC